MYEIACRSLLMAVVWVITRDWFRSQVPTPQETGLSEQCSSAVGYCALAVKMEEALCEPKWQDLLGEEMQEAEPGRGGPVLKERAVWSIYAYLLTFSQENM